MQNLRKIILVLSILVLIIILLMIVISINNKEKKDTENNSINNTSYNTNNDANLLQGEEENPNGEIDYSNEGVNLLNIRSRFFSIEKMINNYFLYLRAGNAKAVYEILDKTYINQNAITEENVLILLRQNIIYDGKYEAKEIYSNYSSAKTIYYIYGTLEKDFSRMQYYLTMYYDATHNSYAIKPISAQEYKIYTTAQQQETYEQDINLNTYNKISNVTVTDEEMAEKYFSSYIHNARYYPEEAYNSLDEEYRSARFGNYTNFLAYITEANKSNELQSLDPHSIKNQEEFATEEEYINYINNLEQKHMTKYYIYSENDKNYCICVDSYDNYYIFEILDVMNYKLILDTYTIDLNEFLKQYEEATTDEKVVLNISKIFEALNNRDYAYVYNKLDAAVITNYFKNYETFATYMQRNLFANNKVTYDSYSEENNLCAYKIIITDNTGKDSRELRMTIVMELGEGTSYKIHTMQFE